MLTAGAISNPLTGRERLGIWPLVYSSAAPTLRTVTAAPPARRQTPLTLKGAASRRRHLPDPASVPVAHLSPVDTEHPARNCSVSERLILLMPSAWINSSPHPRRPSSRLR